MGTEQAVGRLIADNAQREQGKINACFLLPGNHVGGGLTHFFHEPAWGGGGSADSYVFFSGKPRRVDFVGRRDAVRLRVGAATFFIQDFTVAAFAAAHK